MRENSKLLSYCTLLFAFAFGLRFFFSSAVLVQFSELPAQDQISYTIGYLTPDSREYLEVSNALMNGHIRDAVSLIRPIGYPAFLALLGDHPTAILYTQALLLSLIPVFSFLLVSVVTEKNLFGLAAGLASSISPTGIAISSLVLSDGLFASLFAALFTALVYGTLRNSLPYILLSASISGLAILVRPILVFWPVAAVVLSVLIAGFQDESRHGVRRWLRIAKNRRTYIVVLFSIPAVFMISWAEVNYSVHKIFTVSIIGDITIREYLAIKAEEWGVAGHRPSDTIVGQKQDLLRKRFATLTDKEKVNAYLPESLFIFKKYPTGTVKAFLDNSLENSTSGWDYFSTQLPFSQHKFRRVFDWESRLRKIGLALILCAPVIGLIAVRVNPSPYVRRLAAIIFAMTLTFLYFLALSGTTFWTGPRIVYPVEILEISTAAILTAVLVRAIGLRRGDISHT
jgi:hypothetical protein